ncbi:Bacterio-opsin activator HTH domain protein [Natrialba chahannaoensis JCM 10990]|uniref:Bacterio-opsin activator HTH domain protein n=1 Tax=Natrialba chahannaoensis JCM 10990 TaxID=1227492 RepID=M0B7M6_9EURY|nr:Bacterio-opsin activator HTH domain protein [Natrialba chahannaoensis JCM 10990]
MTLEAIHDIDVLADGTFTVFLEVAGAPSQVRESFDPALPRLHDRELIVTSDVTMVQLRYQPTAFNREILEPHRSYGVIVEYPMRFVDPDRSSLRVTVAGPMADVQQLVYETHDLAALTVENVTSYDPLSTLQCHDLTAHQQEVLHTAYECGYYEVPREATYSDIASELGCSASAVGQTLRRIESVLVSATISSTPPSREREV